MISSIKQLFVIGLLFLLLIFRLNADKIVITSGISTEGSLFYKLIDFFDELEKEVTSRGVNAMEEFKESGIKILTPPAFSAPLYLFLHKRHAKLVPYFEKALTKFINKGYYKEILGLEYRGSPDS